MNPPDKQFHLRFIPPAVRSPLRQAAPDPRPRSRAGPLLPAASVNRLSFCDEDLVDFDPSEFPAELVYHPYLKSFPQVGADDFDSSDPYNRARSVSRWRKLTFRLSQALQHPIKPAPYFVGEQSATISLPSSRPSSQATPSSSASAHTIGRLSHTKRSTKAATDSTDSSSILYDSDPFRVDPVSSIGHPASKPVIVEEGEIPDPNCIIPSPPSSCVTTPASITPSSAISSAGNPLRRSIRRLKTFRKNKLSSSQKPAVELQAISDGPTDASATAVASSVPPPCLPELSFDSTPLSLLVPNEHTPDTAVTYHERQEATSPAIFKKPLASSPDTRPAPTFPLIKWERVDPKDLTPSPYSLISADFLPAETPSLVPSPSWLSRNVRDIEPHYTSHLQDQPPSPEPLPILPRSLLPVVSRRASTELGLPNHAVSDNCTYPSSPPQSCSSTLVSSGHLGVPSSRLSVLRYSRSYSDRRSIHSVITVAFATDQESGLAAADQPEESTKPRFLLLIHPVQSPSPQVHELTPDPSPLSLKLPVWFGRSSVPSTPIEPQEIYIPSPQAFADSNDTFPLPSHLRTVLKNISRSSLNTSSMPIDAHGKQVETVDWGEDYDYSGYEWFKDPPPPRPEPPAPQAPAGEPYIPEPGVVEQNDTFDFALKSAPNVLYGRYKQYGQLGVLAWCSEFSELIDALKALGFEGNMFVATRTQALKTCEEILKLNLNIQMQIIVMYLSSQVARLRRFLDTETQFDDYPKTEFPLDYTQYPA